MFADRHVLITGASSGIGACLARTLAREGAHLAIFARRRDRLEALAVECRSLGAREVRILDGDTAQAAQVTRAAAQLEAWPRLDAAFLNAGTGRDMGVARFKADKAEELMRINYLGAVYWLEPLLERMRAQQGGLIAVTGSLAADRGMPKSGPYSASKAALRALVESLRADAAQYGIRVALIEPGFVKSELTDLNRYKMPFLMETQEAVDAILAGLARNAAVIRFPWPLAAISRMGALLPTRLYDRVARRMLNAAGR